MNKKIVQDAIQSKLHDWIKGRFEMSLTSNRQIKSLEAKKKQEKANYSSIVIAIASTLKN